jgi:four helix bundle protein
MNYEREDLRKRTKEFALQAIRLFALLPKAAEAQILGRQALRSATSVGANYREAFRARSRAEFISKMGDCLRELEETAYWLELLADSEIVAGNQLVAIQEENSQLLAIFVTIIKKSRYTSKKTE